MGPRIQMVSDADGSGGRHPEPCRCGAGRTIALVTDFVGQLEEIGADGVDDANAEIDNGDPLVGSVYLLVARQLKTILEGNER